MTHSLTNSGGATWPIVEYYLQCLVFFVCFKSCNWSRTMCPSNWCVTGRSYWRNIPVWMRTTVREVRKGEGPGLRFNIKMSSYWYRKSHCGDKTVIRSSYLHNGISYTGKMSSLYWIGAASSWEKKSFNVVLNTSKGCPSLGVKWTWLVNTMPAKRDNSCVLVRL